MKPQQALVALALCSACVGSCYAPARAVVSCIFSTTAVAFGNYNVFTVAPKLSNGSVSYTCSGYLTGSGTVTITLSKGSAPSYNPRFMQSGANHLDYNLYLNAGLTTIWGDGTGGTSIYGPAIATNKTKVTVTIFGQLPAGQDVPKGAYKDTITATLNF